MCSRCHVRGCEVLVFGDRDFCLRHWMLLSNGERKRLDDLRRDGREVYQAVRDAAVGTIESKLRARHHVGLMGRASGYPGAPGVA